MKLGELLLKERLIEPGQLEQALAHQQASGGRLGRALVALGFLREDEITSLLARRYGVRAVDVAELQVPQHALEQVPAEQARRHLILPIEVSGKVITVAIDDPKNLAALDEVRFRTGLRVQPVVASVSALEQAIERCYGPAPATRDGEPPSRRGSTSRVDLKSAGDLSRLARAALAAIPGADPEQEVDLGTLAEGSPVDKLVKVMLIDAFKRGASDIHVEPYESEFRIRFRIDGILYNVMALPLKLRDPLGSRIRAFCRGIASEKRSAQDGRFRIRLRLDARSTELDYLVSFMPTLWGERIVLQLRDPARLVPDLAALGLEPEGLRSVEQALAAPAGLILVVGPRRCGKTNTLHAAVRALTTPGLNVAAAWYRPELALSGVNHLLVEESGAARIELLLRQNPDVLVADDLPDRDTARTAVRVALEGRRVLASLPEADGVGALESLLEEGLSAASLARASNLVLTQRLVRRICSGCRSEDGSEGAAERLAALGVRSDAARSLPLFRGKGCDECYGSGYRGQIGVFEAMPFSDALRDLLAEGVSPAAVRARALEEGMASIQRNGLAKLEQGVTTLDEVLGRDRTRAMETWTCR